MNPGRYFIPNMGMYFGNPVMMRSSFTAPRSSIGLFNRITQGIRSFNWSGLINGANRTLNVVNQTIPLIRQARPMFGNMKSMLQLAKAFRKETSNNISSTHNSIDKIQNNTINNNNFVQKKEVVNNNYPSFFI